MSHISPAEMGVMDQGEKPLPFLVLLSAWCLHGIGIAQPCFGATITIQHQSWWDFPSPVTEEQMQHLHWTHQRFHTATLQKTPSSRPALSGQDENSPGPNSSALNTMTHWRAFV